MRAFILHEFAQPLGHRGPLEKLAKQVDLAPQFFLRDGLEDVLPA